MNSHLVQINTVHGLMRKKCKQALRQPITTNQCARTIDMPISGAFHLQMRSVGLLHILRIFFIQCCFET